MTTIEATNTNEATTSGLRTVRCSCTRCGAPTEVSTRLPPGQPVGDGIVTCADCARAEDAPTTFKLRAECMADVGQLLQHIAAKRVVVEAIMVPIDYMPWYEGAYAGEDVTLTGPHVGRCPLDLDALRAILATITDGHVMLETVATAAEYTGERTYGAQS